MNTRQRLSSSFSKLRYSLLEFNSNLSPLSKLKMATINTGKSTFTYNSDIFEISLKQCRQVSLGLCLKSCGHVHQTRGPQPNCIKSTPGTTRDKKKLRNVRTGEKTSHGSYAIWQTEETHFILEENLFSHFSLSKVNKLKYWHSLILF